MAKRLTENHPHRKKFESAMNTLHKSGVSIGFAGHRTFVIIDKEKYDLEDFEDSSPVMDVPPAFEYKLVKE